MKTNGNFFMMTKKILITLYTILSLIILCFLAEGSQNIIINFLSYFFILFVQYRALIIKDKWLLNFIKQRFILNYFILFLGILYTIILICLFVTKRLQNIFECFVLMGFISSCFYTFLICIKEK